MCITITVTTVQLQSSSTSVVSRTRYSGVNGAVVSAGLIRRPQAQTDSTLPQHRSVARQQSADAEYSEILELKDICQQDSDRMGATLNSYHTKANVVLTQSDGEYAVPNWSDRGFVASGTQNDYQQLKTDNQEYVALYMTPDMQKPNMLDLDGHEYQLPDAASMDSPGVYAEPESYKQDWVSVTY